MAALARGFSDRHFERGEGPGDEVVQALEKQNGGATRYLSCPQKEDRNTVHLLIYLRVLLLVWRKRRLLSVRSWNFEGTPSLAIDFINRGIDPTVQERHVLLAGVHSVYVPRRRYAKSFEVVRQAAAEAPTPATSSPVPKLGSLLFPPQMRKRGEVTRTRKLMD